MNVRRLLPLLLAMFVLAGCASSQPSSSGPSEPAPSETTTADRSAPQDTTTADAPGAEDDRDAERSVPLVPKRAPSDWQHQSPDAGVIPGIATDKAYATVLDGREPQQTVVVAIIDSGVDVEHEDLEGVIWTNEDEVPGNGKDDDGNGYVDDVHGWNFVGGPDGENVDHAPMELTRMVREYEKEFAGVDSASVSPENRDAYERYQELEAKLNRMRSNKQQEFNNVRNAYEAMNFATELLQQQLGGDSLTVAAVRQLGSPRQDVQQARDIYLYFSDNDLTLSDIEEYKSNLENQLKYGYDLDFNPRPIVGDDPDDLAERIYGNNDVEGPDASHGTHVAGIVAAERDNDLGIRGIASGVRIMPVRAVPDGDERDKDVANAIRYAADNGADVINMSFGKSYSPHKRVVDDAVRYADSLGVLMIHAAGNDGANVDSTDNFPNDLYLSGGSPDLWLTVGASSWQGGEQLVASFSNYGKERVDLFAPGVDIYSTTPDQNYERFPGTSMAAPMVTGVAALIMAYYPELTPAQVRTAILESARPYPEATVTVPGGERTAPFSSLSVSGGVLNAADALRRADQIARTP